MVVLMHISQRRGAKFDPQNRDPLADCQIIGAADSVSETNLCRISRKYGYGGGCRGIRQTGKIYNHTLVNKDEYTPCPEKKESTVFYV